MGKFQEAQKSYPILDLSPAREAQMIWNQGQLERLFNRAFSKTLLDGDGQFVEEMAGVLRNLSLTEKEQQRQLVQMGEYFARQGKIKNAVKAYQHAEKLAPEQPILAVPWNNLCWYGSLWSFPARSDPYLLAACDKAIPQEKIPLYCDSRGLARAINGDYQGAIEDFQIYVAYCDLNGNKKDALQHRQWIARLLTRQERAFTQPDPQLVEGIKELRRQ